MPRKHLPPNDPREWLRRAQSNLARAASPLPDAYLEDFCFDAQQAAEKAIKAVFMAHGLTFPYIHAVRSGGGPIDPIRRRCTVSRPVQPSHQARTSSGGTDRNGGPAVGDATG
jgi:hypothetical protein